MNILKKIIAWTSISICFSACALAQNFELINAGTRARSMGGAYIGIAEDISAVYWNPAGLTQRRGIEVYLSEQKQSLSMWTDIDDFVTSSWEYSHYLPGFCGIKFPTKWSLNHIKIYATISGHTIFDFTEKYSGEDFKIEQDGRVYAIGLSLSYQYNDNLFFGISENVYYGSRNFKFNDLTNHDAGSVTEDYQYRGWVCPPKFGVLYHRAPYRFGLTVKFPFRLHETRTDDKKYETLIYLPYMIGLGWAFNLSNDLLLSADLEWKNYSRFYRKYQKPYEQFAKNEKEKIEIMDIWQLRLGGEYYYRPRENFGIPFRMGLAAVPSYQKFFKENKSGQIKGVLYSFGSGIATKYFNLEFCVELINYPYHIPAGEYREKYRNLLLSISGRW